MKNKILQLLQWKIKDIINYLPKIKYQGFTHIQISPIQPHKKGNEWWKLYQPLDFSIGNDLCTKEQLIELCTKAKKIDIGIIVDVVLNHCANKGGGFDQLIPSQEVNKEWLDNPYIWKEKKFITDWNNRYEVVNYCPSLPAFRLDNYDFQDEYILPFLYELIDCGVSGFRFDSAKSIALPSECSDFWIRIVDKLKAKKNDLMLYAEVIYCNQSLLYEYMKYINVITSIFELNFSDGKDNRMFTYIENHDSYLDNQIGYSRNFDDNLIIQEYELAVKKFNNVLFYARPFNDTWLSDRVFNINNTYK